MATAWQLQEPVILRHSQRGRWGIKQARARAGGECRGEALGGQLLPRPWHPGSRVRSGRPEVKRSVRRRLCGRRRGLAVSRKATSSSSTPRSERRRSRLSCGISSGSSSQRRRPSDQILDERGESSGASTHEWRPQRRRPSDQVEPKLTKRRRPSDQVESAGASTPGQKPRRQSDALESIADLVGPASETREAHLLRHGGGQLTCPRCRYYVHGTAWTATY